MPRQVMRAILLAGALAGCGGGGETDRRPATGAAARPSGKGACGLLMQAEVDAIFGASVGAGASETLEGGKELCSWPAGEDPALLLQVEPALASATAAVDLGEGYRVVEIEAMSGPAALSVETGGEGTVAVLALNASGKTVTLSPIGLGVQDGSDRLEKLKELMELVAERAGATSG